MESMARTSRPTHCQSRAPLTYTLHTIAGDAGTSANTLLRSLTAQVLSWIRETSHLPSYPPQSGRQWLGDPRIEAQTLPAGQSAVVVRTGWGAQLDPFAVTRHTPTPP